MSVPAAAHVDAHGPALLGGPSHLPVRRAQDLVAPLGSLAGRGGQVPAVHDEFGEQYAAQEAGRKLLGGVTRRWHFDRMSGLLRGLGPVDGRCHRAARQRVIRRHDKRLGWRMTTSPA